MNQNKNLLFVDDENDVLDILVDLFKDEGYELHTASRADEALTVFNKHSIDFVLSDLKLPDAPGDILLEEIRDRSPDTVRVLTSGYLDVDFGCIGENNTDGTLYLSKPWDLWTLRDLVSERLAQ
ncbi:response regulator [bacterium]|nr:response regulator [bacterium]